MAALRYFRKSADQGMALAENAVGEMLQAGKGDKADAVAAFGWFDKAAKQGLAQAELNLAVCYEKGTGVKQDAKLALDWYKKAAAQGNDQAKAAATRLEKSLGTKTSDSNPRPGPLSGPGK
jgi:TPR repeat protein